MDFSNLKYARRDWSIERERTDRGAGINREQVLVEHRACPGVILNPKVDLELQGFIGVLKWI